MPFSSFSLYYFYLAKDFDCPGFFFFFFSTSHSRNSLGFTEPARDEGGHLPKIRLGSPRGNSGFGPLAKDDGLRHAGATLTLGTATTPWNSEGHPPTAGVVDGGGMVFYDFLLALYAAFRRGAEVCWEEDFSSPPRVGSF